MMSKPFEPTRGSRQRTQKRRTSSSSWAMRFGVNTRDMSPRCVVCTGGSSNMTTPLGSSMPAFMMSRMSLRLLEKTCQFDQSSLDVLVSRQSPEVVSIVVVDRRFLAEPLIGRVRVGIDVDDVRIEVDAGIAHESLRPILS